jgi:hypothetical protein
LNKIQYWNELEQKLQFPITTKIKKLVEGQRIKGASPGSDHDYECLPIAGYNVTTYRLWINAGGIRCSCQGFNKKGNCSHERALRIVRIAAHPQRELF